MVQEPRQIIKMVEIKRIKFIGYVTQYNKFIINNIMKGKINEKEEKDDREIQIQNKKAIISTKLRDNEKICRKKVNMVAAIKRSLQIKKIHNLVQKIENICCAPSLVSLMVDRAQA